MIEDLALSSPPVTAEEPGAPSFTDFGGSVAASPKSRSKWVVRRPLQLVFVVGGLLWLHLGLGDYANTLVITAAITTMVCLGLHVLVQWSGQISIAQMAFVGIGGFMTAKFAVGGVPLPAAILLGTLVTGAATLLLGVPALRIRGFALAIVTFIAGYAADQWLFQLNIFAGNGMGIVLPSRMLFGLDLAQPIVLGWVSALVAVLLIFLVYRIDDSAFGRSLRLVANDEEAAAAYGINVRAHKLIAFVIAGLFAGLAGAFSVIQYSVAEPSLFPVSQSVVFLSFVLLGGRGTAKGTINFAVVSSIVFPLIHIGNYETLFGDVGLIWIVRQHAGGFNEMSAAHIDVMKRAVVRLFEGARPDRARRGALPSTRLGEPS